MTDASAGSGRILVVDDDPRIRQMLTRYFEDEGYSITAVPDGGGLRRSLQSAVFDIILLDLMLPGGEDGLSLAREIRLTSDIPIIMLTGRDDVVDKIVGLEVGADDYIAKPFHLREVLARLKTVLRRRRPPVPVAAPAPGNGVLRFEGWSLDPGRRQLLDGSGAEVPLTTGEFDMLLVLARQPGRVFTREMLMDLTRARNWDAYDRTIDSQIARLRRKIEPDLRNPTLIKSVRGVGYVFTGRAVG
ncbi:response regulator [Ancylobacter sp. 6x-1]|uniref:Response regulator n=1 Tax=Ancylobacter crimeensis TaxID=2579147 RepID=A0ABT0D5U4_9HYPH|nr:response regulator [Ancylobacter crimeensis]MCK0195315.1 response regulator [Ancylobacter crimeensis]